MTSEVFVQLFVGRDTCYYQSVGVIDCITPQPSESMHNCFLIFIHIVPFDKTCFGYTNILMLFSARHSILLNISGSRMFLETTNTKQRVKTLRSLTVFELFTSVPCLHTPDSNVFTLNSFM